MLKKKPVSSTIEEQMERLSFEVSEDSRSATYQKIYGAAIGLAGQKNALENLDVFMQQNAQKVLKRSKQFTEDQISYENIATSMAKLNQYQSTKIAVFQVQASSSSSQQIQPQYQTAEEVVNIGAGAPISLQFYIVAKIIWPKLENEDQAPIQPVLSVKKIKFFKRADQPSVQTSFSQNQYRIYKITVNSLIKNYEIECEWGEVKLQVANMQFNQNQHLICPEKGIIIDVSQQKILSLDLFEQALIFSLFSQTQHEGLKEIVSTVQVYGRDQYNISQGLINTICASDDLQFCRGLLDRLLKIRASSKLKPNSELNSLLAKILLTNKSHPNSHIHSSSQQQQLYFSLLAQTVATDNQKFQELYIKIDSIINYIEATCNAKKLGHYKAENLFANYSEDVIRSLVFLAIQIGRQEKYNQEEIVKECISKLACLANKDLGYILEYYLKEQKQNQELITDFRQAIKAKSKKESSSKFAVILATDQDCWRTIKSDDEVIVVKAEESQANLKKNIKNYLLKKKNNGVLYLDCISTNLCPNPSYLVYLYKQCFNELKKQRKQFSRNKLRIIIKSKNKNNQSVQVPFLQDYDIFCLDDIGAPEKHKIIQQIVTVEVYRQCFDGFVCRVHQMEHNQDINTILTELETEIVNNKLFDECCKQLLLHTSCNICDGTEQQIKNSLQIPYNKSITIPITKLVLARKMHEPISYLIRNFAHDNLLLNYGERVREKLLACVVLDRENYHTGKQKQKCTQKMDKIVGLMGLKKVEMLKKGYREVQRQNNDAGQVQGQGEGEGQIKVENLMKQVKPQQQQQKVEISLTFPTFVPFSQIQTKAIFSPQNIQSIKALAKSDVDEFPHKFKYYQVEYNKKLEQAFGQFNNINIFDLYYDLTRGKNNTWRSMLIADICLGLAEKIKITKKYIFHCVSQLQKIFKEQENILKIIVLILGHLQIFGPALRIFSCFTQNKIQKLIECDSKFNQKQLGLNLLNHCHEHLRMEYTSISRLSASGNLNEKLKLFAQIHHVVYFQIDNLLSAGQFQSNNLVYKQMAITEDFMNIWTEINKQNPQFQFEEELKKLEQKKYYFQKIGIVMEYLYKFMKEQTPLAKKVQQYLANKLFPSWFNQCTDETQINVVFDKFYSLCERSPQFAHNSTGSVQIALSCLNLDYSNKSIGSTIQKLKNTKEQHKNKETLKKKLLIKMGSICQQKIFNDNLSVLISNIMFINLRRFNSLIQNPDLGFTYQDLQNSFQYFTKLIQSILSGSSSILKLFAFAYIKIYLLYYIETAKPQDPVCIQIDKILSQQNKLMANLRLYCVKLLRRRYTSKQICERYINIGTFKWCNFMKQEMKEHQARAIQVPKLPQNYLKNDIQQKIRLFMDSQGKQVHYLDQIITLGCASIEGRYIILNFFMKYMYTMAYNKAYEQIIISHVKSKQTEYSSKIGKEQYALILRYTTSKFDEIYFVQNHQSFSQSQFLLFNNINWLFASRKSRSPIHSLFFNLQTDQCHDKISQEISKSFVPCGIENLFVNQAKAIIAATRSCNIGVYICDAQCDYIYCLEDCGWPGSAGVCQICGEPIASAGGHKLQRVDKGGRRIMSKQFKDDGRLYVWRSNLVKYEQLWQAQRYYITAEINRMKVKTSMRLKPLVNNKREVQMQSLLGYQFNNNYDKIGLERVSSIGTKVIMECLQSSLYALVSLDIIKPQEYATLFGINNKNEILHKLSEKINKNIAGMKQILDLNTKFYTWVLGIQAEHYKLLINFQHQFNNYVANIQKQSNDLSTKLKTKQQGFTDALFKTLYTDMINAINAGLVTKQIKQIKAKKEMSARNQFTRQVYQQFIDKLIAMNLFESKLKFVEKWYETQGKMQFPFDVVLTQSKIDTQLYAYSRVLKLPSESLTFQQISTKYETIISQRYPFLNYLLSTTLQLNMLSSFATVVSNCNNFFNKINYQLTRGFTKMFPLSKFNQDMCRGQINAQEFIKAWKQISGYLGSIQVGCKVYGTMNDQFNVDSQVYGFLLDDTLKQNANGKVIVGIFNNFAVLHNQILTVLNTNKNLIPKYQKLNFMLEGQKVSPQKITPQHTITLSQKQLMSIILQSSVPSIIYGQNLTYHNFDYCQGYFLNKLKGKCQLDPNTEKYVSIKYVGQTFSIGTTGTNVNAIGVVRQAAYESINEQDQHEILTYLKGRDQKQVYALFGQIQQLINKMSANPQHITKHAETKIVDYLSQFPTLSLENILVTPIISERPVSQLAAVFAIMERYIRPYLLPTIPEKYTLPIKEQLLLQIKQYLRGLPSDQQQAYDTPTIAQFYTAIENFIYRNLLSEFYDQDKTIFEFIVEKEDYWGYQYDVYTKNMGIYNTPAIMGIKAGNVMEFLKVIKQERDSRK